MPTPTHISSVQNPRIKAAVRLRDRKGREEQGRIIIDGAREIERAVTGGVQIEELYYCGDAGSGEPSISQAFQAAAANSAETFEVSRAVLEKLSFGDRTEGLIAVALTPRRDLQSFTPSENALLGVLVGVEKPGNIGAVARSADGAGVGALIVADGGTDIYNPNVIRASLGVVFTLPVFSATSEVVLAWLRQHGAQLVAARVDGGKEYTAVDYRPTTAIVLGSEATGLSPLWNATEVTSVRLPMLGSADSLNVSCTAAVLFYEALRQRR